MCVPPIDGAVDRVCPIVAPTTLVVVRHDLDLDRLELGELARLPIGKVAAIAIFVVPIVVVHEERFLHLARIDLLEIAVRYVRCATAQGSATHDKTIRFFMTASAGLRAKQHVGSVFVRPGPLRRNSLPVLAPLGRCAGRSTHVYTGFIRAKAVAKMVRAVETMTRRTGTRLIVSLVMCLPACRAGSRAGGDPDGAGASPPPVPCPAPVQTGTATNVLL